MEHQHRLLAIALAIVGAGVFLASASAAAITGQTVFILIALLDMGVLLAGFLVFERDRLNRRTLGTLASQLALVADPRRDMEVMSRRIEALEARQPVQNPGAANAGLIKEVQALRHSIRDFANEKIPAAPSSAATDKLDLMLEPMIDLRSGTTSHYRAHVTLTPEHGPPVGGDALLAEADRSGLRPSLDVFAVTRVAAVLRRIRQKRPGASVFVPLGASALSSAGHLASIVRAVQGLPGGGHGIVFAIDHAAMAILSQPGIEGLARLAQAGAEFALARANPSGIELNALKDLRFRFIMFEASTLPEAKRVPPLWSGLGRFAQHQGFAIVVVNCATETQAEGAESWADLGAGSVFAPPRLVRGDLGEAEARRFAA